MVISVSSHKHIIFNLMVVYQKCLLPFIPVNGVSEFTMVVMKVFFTSAKEWYCNLRFINLYTHIQTYILVSMYTHMPVDVQISDRIVIFQVTSAPFFYRNWMMRP